MPRLTVWEFIDFLAPPPNPEPIPSEPTEDWHLANNQWLRARFLQGGAVVASTNGLRLVGSFSRKTGDVRLVVAENAFYRFDNAASDAEDLPDIVAPQSGTGRWFKTEGRPTLDMDELALGINTPNPAENQISGGQFLIPKSLPQGGSDKDMIYNLTDNLDASGNGHHLEAGPSGFPTYNLISIFNRTEIARFADAGTYMTTTGSHAAVSSSFAFAFWLGVMSSVSIIRQLTIRDLDDSTKFISIFLSNFSSPNFNLQYRNGGSTQTSLFDRSNVSGQAMTFWRGWFSAADNRFVLYENEVLRVDDDTTSIVGGNFSFGSNTQIRIGGSDASNDVGAKMQSVWLRVNGTLPTDDEWAKIRNPRLHLAETTPMARQVILGDNGAVITDHDEDDIFLDTSGMRSGQTLRVSKL